MKARVIVLFLLIMVILVTACGDDGDEPNGTTATQPAPATQGGPTLPPASPEPTSVIGLQTTENTLGFGRDPVNAQPTSAEQSILMQVSAGTPELEPEVGPFDRIALQFDGSLPGYSITYVDAPILGCASGLEEAVAGEAFLQIRMQPAVAHDEAGNPTISENDQNTGLPVLLQAKQTCDFEGVVIWTLGLAEEVDFRVNTLGGALLVIDLKHAAP
jgi:hypothetical protein